MPFISPARRALVAFLLAAAGLEALAQTPALTSYTMAGDNTARLEQGEIIQVGDVDFRDQFGTDATQDGESTLVMLLADAPEAVAWSVFTGDENQHELMPQMAESEVVSDEETRAVRCSPTTSASGTQARSRRSRAGRFPAWRKRQRPCGAHPRARRRSTLLTRPGRIDHEFTREWTREIFRAEKYASYTYGPVTGAACDGMWHLFELRLPR